MPDIPLPSHFYEAASLPLSAQRLVNLYPEIAPSEAKSRFALYGTSGMTEFAELPGGPVRGMGVLDGSLYAVSENTLHLIDNGGSATAFVGNILGGDQLDFAPGRTEMVILSSQEGWVVNTSGTLTKITDADFQIASSVTQMDSYFIYSVANSRQFFISELNDALVYNALFFAEKEGAPDKIRAVFRDHRELWVFGEETTEVWYNSGDLDFPFTRISGAFVERGCIASKSIAADDNTLFWFGDDKIVYKIANYTPVRISTHAIEETLRTQSNLESALGFIYTERGHKFYVLRLDNICFEYNIASGRWHERQSFNLPTWRANAFVSVYNKNFVGDSQSGKIFELDPDVFDENGATVQRIAAFPPIGDDVPRISNTRLQIVFETGVGLTTGQGSDPQAMLRWSDDGGKTWSNEHWATIGKKGNYLTRVLWRRLGRFRSRVFEVTISDPVKIAIIKAHAIGKSGTS